MRWIYTNDIFIWNDWALNSFALTLHSAYYSQTRVNGPFNYRPNPETFEKLSNNLDHFRLYKAKIAAIPNGGGDTGPFNYYCMLTEPTRKFEINCRKCKYFKNF